MRNICPCLNVNNQSIVTYSDEELKKIHISSLTMPSLKVQLQARDLSATHQVKNDLIQRLLTFLANTSTAS